MNLSFPLTPEMLREGMKEVITKIKEETNWDEERSFSDIQIEIGNAPKYFETFGVVREDNKLIFGSWLNDINPNDAREYIVNFLIIRECFNFYIKEILSIEKYKLLMNLMLNILGLCYLKMEDENRSYEAAISNVVVIFLQPKEQASNEENFLNEYFKLHIINFVKQKISYKLLLETIYYFVEDMPSDSIDIEELLNDLVRYISLSPDEISMPINLMERPINLIENLIKYGYKTTFSELSNKLNLDNSSITREISKIVSRYRAFWKAEKNWNKLGLYTYLIILRFKNKDENYNLFEEKLSKNNYLFELFIGENDDFHYLYTVIHSPHTLISNLIFEFEKMQKNKMIHSFDIKQITKRSYFTSFFKDRLSPKKETISNLLHEKIPIKNIEIWSTDVFQDKDRMDINNKDILEFLAILIHSSLTGYKIFGVYLNQCYKFLEKKNISKTDMTQITDFLSVLEDEAFNSNLLQYRLQLTYSELAANSSLVIKLDIPSTDKKLAEIIKSLNVFSFSIILESYDSSIIIINGPSRKSLIYNSINDYLKKLQINFEIFSMSSKMRKCILLHELYDLEHKKWKI